MENKPIVIIDCYINSKEKEDILNQSIVQWKKTGFDILIVSHSILPEYIINKVNFYLYDSVNYLLPKENSPLVWFASGEGTVHLYPKGNSFAVMRNLYLALKFIQSLDYQYFYFTEYDNIFDEKDLKTLENEYNNLIGNGDDVFFCRFKTYEDIQYETRFFIGNTNFILKTIDFPKTPEEWKTKPSYMYTSHNLERIFVELFSNINNKLVFYNGYLHELCPNSIIDSSSIVQDVSIIYNNDKPDLPLLFIINQTPENICYYITIDNETKFINNSEYFCLNPGEHSKKFFELLDNDILHIYVEFLNRKEEFIINKNNITQYKETGNYYKIV